jgi:DHA3 family tetracycline resistance protein-like MFS transporter
MKPDPGGNGDPPSRRLPVIFEPLRQRDFRLLWSGMTVSLIGDGIFIVSLAWQVYDLSNVATALSLVGLAMTVPNVIFLLIGGVVSDRFDRRRVLLAADLVRGLAVGAMGALSLSGHIELWHLMVLAAFYGSGTAFFGPAFDAIVPDLVATDLLIQANALDQFVRPAAWRLLGPAIGGALLHWSLGGAFLVDAATFGASIVALLLMSPHPIEAAAGETTAFAEVREGFRFVRARVWLWGTLLAAAFAYLLFIGPQEVLLPLLVKNSWGGDPLALGFILAMGGVGAIGAALIMGRRAAPRRFITFMYLAWTCSTLAVAGFGLAHVPWQAMVACFLFNALETAGTIVWQTTKQRLVPRQLLGRVSSLDWFISIGLLPLSFALTGPVANIIGPRHTLIGAGVLGAIVTFSFLFLPGMRSIERTAEDPPSPDPHGPDAPGPEEPPTLVLPHPADAGS